MPRLIQPRGNGLRFVSGPVTRYAHLASPLRTIPTQRFILASVLPCSDKWKSCATTKVASSLLLSRERDITGDRQGDISYSSSGTTVLSGE